jgi:ferredoxin
LTGWSPNINIKSAQTRIDTFSRGSAGTAPLGDLSGECLRNPGSGATLDSVARRARAVASSKQPDSPPSEGIDTTMKVWIDQDLCTGDGLCEEIAPSVFTLLDDGLAYVKEGDKVLSNPGGAEGLAVVPGGMEEATIESAEECPGECIFIEVD